GFGPERRDHDRVERAFADYETPAPPSLPQEGKPEEQFAGVGPGLLFRQREIAYLRLGVDRAAGPGHQLACVVKDRDDKPIGVAARYRIVQVVSVRRPNGLIVGKPP